MASNEMPQPPYFLVFEEVVPGAQPLAITVDERGAVPLFDSAAKAEAFLASRGSSGHSSRSETGSGTSPSTHHPPEEA